MTEAFERLAAAGIQLLPATEITTHYVFERGGFGAIGGTGLLTGKGFAAAVLRGGSWSFIAKDFEQEATPEQAEELRRFSQDLKSALEA